MVNFLASTFTLRPYPRAVFEVMGPMLAIAAPFKKFFRVAMGNKSTKFLTVDELVNVTM